MRIRGIDRQTRKQWERQKSDLGYYPHYQKVGRVLMEVRFIISPMDRRSWTVLNLVTREVLVFRKNGSPITPWTRGKLIGPLIHKERRRVRCLLPEPLAASASR